MEINDMNELIEEIINCCYKSEEDIYWIPFEDIFEDCEFDEDIINSIKINLNKHKNVKICDTWDYCFLIRVNKYFTDEETEEENDW